jgi:molybdopterin adenylyltransferase
MLAIAVITISDRAYKKEYEDLSGPVVRDILFAGLGTDAAMTIVPDEKAAIQKAIRENADKDCILTTGGTGLSPRDITPEATREVCDKDIPGISEWLRAESLKETPNAVLSRGYSGLMGRTIVVNLPGSVKAAAFCAKLLVPILEHGAEMVRGGKH